jgi:hypothetical protein
MGRVSKASTCPKLGKTLLGRQKESSCGHLYIEGQVRPLSQEVLLRRGVPLSKSNLEF